ncbi:hypothetical protein BDW02DRAFT_320817 [Decorospora gaudefroyi]|uniref:Uncharacterized protein n=1 Tax=Decorospora gaudefroyi TaxID=184978 RepID=A0A6A5KMW1_9PLEO|nr:hypothetical protein BDW02DRAFT_320817 [Decorospora gaudefroyi]
METFLFQVFGLAARVGFSKGGGVYGMRLRPQPHPKLIPVVTILAGLETCRKQICNLWCVPSLFCLFYVDYEDHACFRPRVSVP